MFINRYTTQTKIYYIELISTDDGVRVQGKYIKGTETPLNISLAWKATRLVPQDKSLCKEDIRFIMPEHGTLITWLGKCIENIQINN